MTMPLLHHAFEGTAQRLPDKVALVVDDRRVHYRELALQVRSLAHALHSDGVRPGERVAVMLPPGVEYAAALHAVWRIGAVAVPVDARSKSARLGFVCDDTGAAALLTHVALAREWASVLATRRDLRACHAVGATRDGRVRPWPAAAAGAAAPSHAEDAAQVDDLAALLYTSGTSGESKGAMLTHRNMTSAWAMVQAYLGLREDDVIGLALPPTHSYGLYNLLMGLGVGATVVIERQAPFPLRVAQTLARERVTVFPGVPTLFAALLDLPALAGVDLRALRLVTNAAAALPLAHLQRLRALLPQARLVPMYGLTECMRASYLPAAQLDRRPGSVGRGLPGQEHWLVDEQGARLPHGSTGELVLRGPHVMRGYWKRPQESARRLRVPPEGGAPALHTGDLFRSDAEGYLHFVARRDDIIKTRGEKVAPGEVEAAICELDGVSGCAVVGVADARLGQAIKAFVTLRPGAAPSARHVIRHCLARLESYMAPKLVEFVPELPRTDSGKVRHASLR